MAEKDSQIIEPRERLRLLYFVSIYQPILVRDLRTLYLRATKDVALFAALLKDLRDSGHISHTDPVTCTEQGQQIVQTLPPISKARDIARMFYLKDVARNVKVWTTSDE